MVRGASGTVNSDCDSKELIESLEDSRRSGLGVLFNFCNADAYDLGVDVFRFFPDRVPSADDDCRLSVCSALINPFLAFAYSSETIYDKFVTVNGARKDYVK